MQVGGGFYSSCQSEPKKQPNTKKFEQNFRQRRFTNNTVGSRSVSVNGGALRGIPIHSRKHCQRQKSNMTPVNLCMQNLGRWKQIIKRLKLGCKRLIFTELAVFYPPLFVRTEIPFQRTCKDSGATLLPQTAQGCFAKENGPQSAGVIENHEKYPSLIL